MAKAKIKETSRGIRGDSLCLSCDRTELCEWLLSSPTIEKMDYWKKEKKMKIVPTKVSNLGITAGYTIVYPVTKCPLYLSDSKPIKHRKKSTKKLNKEVS